MGAPVSDNADELSLAADIHPAGQQTIPGAVTQRLNWLLLNVMYLEEKKSCL